MIDKELMEQVLLREKERILQEHGEREGIAAHQSTSDSLGELSLADNHPADIGSETFERSKDLSLHQKRLYDLQKIEKALEKLKTGDYGKCETCGGDIDKERLQAIPYARWCLPCQEAKEKDVAESDE